MNRIVGFAFVSLALAALPALAQVTYQWKDPKTGNMIYSDQPPPPGVQAVERKGSDAGDTPRQSYATRIASEKFPVTLYTTADCLGQCANGRNLLNGRGVPFNEKIVLTNDAEAMAELKNLSGGEAMVPLLLVGTQRFKGFDPSSWNNLLDLAGYPKSAPYGSRPSGAFAK